MHNRLFVSKILAFDCMPAAALGFKAKPFCLSPTMLSHADADNVKVAGLRIYLIEDGVPMREHLVDRFEAMMARVVGWSDTEQEGAQWLTQNESAWDLVIVDPFVNARLKGYGILVRCKNRRADQKLVLLTVYATRQVRRSSLANGANAVFDKALELEDLFRYVAGEVKNRQQTWLPTTTPLTDYLGSNALRGEKIVNVPHDEVEQAVSREITTIIDNLDVNDLRPN